VQHLVFHEIGRYKKGYPQSLGMIGGKPVKAFTLRPNRRSTPQALSCSCCPGDARGV
jgi:hypothetical protein